MLSGRARETGWGGTLIWEYVVVTDQRHRLQMDGAAFEGLLSFMSKDTHAHTYSQLLIRKMNKRRALWSGARFEDGQHLNHLHFQGTLDHQRCRWKRKDQDSPRQKAFMTSWSFKGRPLVIEGGGNMVFLIKRSVAGTRRPLRSAAWILILERLQKQVTYVCDVT